MALTVQDAANRLLGRTHSSWTVSASSLPGTVKLEIARCISATEQEMREINPAAFAVEKQILLAAPATLTVDVSGSGLTVTATSGTIPNAGCTVLIAGDTNYNRIASVSSSTVGTLVRAHAAGDGSGQSCTLWHDCWVPGDGSSFERILGEVFAANRLLQVLTNESELTQGVRRNDYGDIRMGYAVTTQTGRVEACWPEAWNTIGAAGESRLRFYPMPSSQTLVRALVLTRAADCTSSDLDSTTRKVSVPGGGEELYFMPLLMRRWLGAPWMRPTPEAAQEIKEAAQMAADKLAVWRPVYASQPVLLAQRDWQNSVNY